MDVLFEKKQNKKKQAESVQRRDTVSRAPSASAIRDAVKHGQMRLIHSSTPLQWATSLGLQGDMAVAGDAESSVITPSFRFYFHFLLIVN